MRLFANSSHLGGQRHDLDSLPQNLVEHRPQCTWLRSRRHKGSELIRVAHVDCAALAFKHVDLSARVDRLDCLRRELKCIGDVLRNGISVSSTTGACTAP